MTSKKPHPIFSKAKKRETAKPRHRKWLVIILLLPILIIGYLVWSQPNSDNIVTPIANSPAIADQQAPTTIVSETDANTENLDDASEITDANLDNTTQELDIPNPKAIVNAPLPETNSLAKEEIDRLDDERQRLKEQEKMVAEQVAMTKSLTEMKAEQIDLLEQQIAELEAKQAAKQ